MFWSSQSSPTENSEEAESRWGCCRMNRTYWNWQKSSASAPVWDLCPLPGEESKHLKHHSINFYVLHDDLALHATRCLSDVSTLETWREGVLPTPPIALREPKGTQQQLCFLPIPLAITLFKRKSEAGIGDRDHGPFWMSHPISKCLVQDPAIPLSIQLPAGHFPRRQKVSVRYGTLRWSSWLLSLAWFNSVQIC